MKNEGLYFYCGFSSMYDTLHGMFDGNIEEGTLDDMELNAQECSRQVIENYDCIMQAIHDDLNETFGYDDTPDDPDEDYLDALEAAIGEEIAYVVYRVTEEGENHIDEMEEDVSNYPDYVKNGWLVDPTV